VAAFFMAAKRFLIPVRNTGVKVFKQKFKVMPIMFSI
jgi:hypothetical protein